MSTRTWKNKDKGDNLDEDSSKEYDMGLFVKRYNRYMRKNNLKHSDKNLINFKKSHPYKKENERKEENVTCFECGKLVHYRTTCLRLNKHNKKNDKESFKTKGKHVKGRKAYITWEKENVSSSSSYRSCSDNECVNIYLMAHKKSENSKVYTFDPEFKFSYKQLSKAFSEMHADALYDFKKIYFQKKLISKHEKEINDINSVLDSLKE